MTALIEDRGKGHRVEGEVCQISQALLNRLDRLESYSADDEANSAYLRRTVAEVYIQDGVRSPEIMLLPRPQPHRPAHYC